MEDADTGLASPHHHHRAWKLLGAGLLSLALFLHARSEGLHKTSSPSKADVDTKGPFLRASNTSAASALPPLQECRPRRGWPHVFGKLSRNSSAAMTVAFMGGSVTAKVDCWVPQTTEILRRLSPNVAWTGINAGVGATGAHWGAFRFEKDVAVHEPDLIFLEFAINDNELPNRVSRVLAGHGPWPVPARGACAQRHAPTHPPTHQPHMQVTQAMEGLVRQIRRRLPQTDIAIVYIMGYLTVDSFDEARGIAPPIVGLWETIAEYYGIPSLHLGLEVLRLHKEGRVVWKAPMPEETSGDDSSSSQGSGLPFIFGGDGIHPHAATGCKEYAQAIDRSLPLLRDATTRAAAHDEKEKEEQYRLPAPLDRLNFEHVQCIELDPARTEIEIVPSIGEKIPLPYPLTYPHPGIPATVYVARKPGDTFILHFRGTYVGVYGIVGPFSGDLIATLDGQETRSVQVFSSYNYYTRTGNYILFDDLEEGNHTLVLDVSPTVPGKLRLMAKRIASGQLNLKTFTPFLNTTDFIPLAFSVA